MFKSRKQKFKISEVEPTYKVRYLGNVQTALMKGDGCVDKPTSVLWNNYVKTGTAGLEMQLTITASGLKALTKEQGVTEYRAHRISYCIAHPKYPKLFIWVYRHEGKKMKVELRCHAVLCKTEVKAKLMAVQLHEKLSVALNEFMREKTRRQTTRLTLQRTNSLPSNTIAGSHNIASGTPARKKFLNVGKNFKPPVERSPSAPKLGDITEDIEQEEEEEALAISTYLRGIAETEEGEEDYELEGGSDAAGDQDSDQLSNDLDLMQNGFCDLEIGNDIDALRQDVMNGDSDEESIESGFSEQGDAKESASSASTGSASSAMSESSGTGSISTNDSLRTVIDKSETLSANGHVKTSQGQTGGRANGQLPESVRL